MRRVVAGLLVTAAAMAAPAVSAAVPALTGEFPVDGTPGRLTVDASGSAWVSVPGAAHDVARVTPAGVATHFDLPGVGNIAAFSGLTTAPDGRVWGTAAQVVAHFSPADPVGTLVTIPIPQLISPDDLTFGPGGRVYTAATVGAQARIFIVDPASGTVVNPGGTVVTGLQSPRGIAAGGDGKLYLGDFAGNQVVSFDPATDAAVAYPVGGGVQAVAAGPGQQVAYSVPSDVLGRLTPGDTPAPTTVVGADSFGLALGADGAYWAPHFVGAELTRFTPEGTATQPIAFTDAATAGPRRVAAGADGTIWVSLEYPGFPSGKVARVAGLETPAPPSPPSASGARPGLSPVIAPRSVRRGAAVPVRVRLDQAAVLRVRVDRVLAGRRTALGRCVAPRAAPRGARPCARYVTVRIFARPGVAGMNRLKVGLRSPRRAIVPGRYRIGVSARGSTPPATSWRRAVVRVLAR